MFRIVATGLSLSLLISNVGFAQQKKTTTPTVVPQFGELFNPGKDCKFVGERAVNPKIFGTGVGIALRKTDPDLRDKLNAALKQILADGTYEAINKKYFPFSIY